MSKMLFKPRQARSYDVGLDDCGRGTPYVFFSTLSIPYQGAYGLIQESTSVWNYCVLLVLNGIEYLRPRLVAGSALHLQALHNTLWLPVA